MQYEKISKMSMDKLNKVSSFKSLFENKNDISKKACLKQEVNTSKLNIPHIFQDDMNNEDNQVNLRSSVTVKKEASEISTRLLEDKVKLMKTKFENKCLSSNTVGVTQHEIADNKDMINDKKNKRERKSKSELNLVNFKFLDEDDSKDKLVRHRNTEGLQRTLSENLDSTKSMKNNKATFDKSINHHDDTRKRVEGSSIDKITMKSEPNINDNKDKDNNSKSDPKKIVQLRKVQNDENPINSLVYDFTGGNRNSEGKKKILLNRKSNRKHDTEKCNISAIFNENKKVLHDKSENIDHEEMSVIEEDKIYENVEIIQTHITKQDTNMLITKKRPVPSVRTKFFTREEMVNNVI